MSFQSNSRKGEKMTEQEFVVKETNLLKQIVDEMESYEN